MSAADSKLTGLNILVAIGVCAAAFIVARMPRKPLPPPNDPWFKSAVIDRSEPVLVKFGADWCGPCRMMEPELDHLANQLRGEITVVRVNVDRHRDLARHYGVSSIPRLMLFRHGQVVADRVGFLDRQHLRQWIASNSKD